MIVTLISCCLAMHTEVSRVQVVPEESDAPLPNPGMGWQTFHHFADADPNLAGLPSTSAYFRLYWSEMEPVEELINFAKFDELLANARKAGQKLAFRIMCVGTNRDYMHVPEWLKDKGCRGFEYLYRGRGPAHWVPDMDDPMFLEAHFRLIKELGMRYDGHPDLDLVDIGSVGLWGEWHMSGTGVDVPSMETRLAIIDAYCRAFRRTPRVMLIGDAEGLKHAISKRCGWRADCLGDMGGFSENWNHMEHFYRQQIEKTGAEDAWKLAPIAFESCWDMRKWKEENWDIPFIFNYALDLHASYLNNKSAPIPEGTRDEIEHFLRKLGYRLVLRQLEHDRTAASDSEVSISMIWENIGVAPPYRDYLIALRLTGDEGRKPFIHVSETSIKNWLPGRVEISESVRLPAYLKPGQYTLALAVVDPMTQEPAIHLAIAGRTDDGWYPLSQIEIAERQ